MPSIPHVAAICVYPTFVAEAKEALAGSGVKVASVSTAFPSGQSFLDIKLAETRAAVAAGADEIDMVIARRAATSTCRSRRTTSGTTPAGRTSSSTPSRAGSPGRSGVAAQVIPWNFPLLMLAWKIAPALAAGNTVVLKPASTTPLSALLFAEVCLQADLPAGVVNIVPGPSDIGMHLVSHPDVDKVAFTGSTGVGKLIHKATAGTDKALTLELGGKAANIVFEDAALDQAVEGIVNGIYFNQGEVCCAGSRLLVQESIQGPLIEKLKDRLSTIRVGDPLDKNTDVGRDQLEGPAREDHRARRGGRGRGRRDVPAGVRPARARLLLPPDAVHERRAEPPDRTRGDLRRRCCPCSPSGRRTRRSRRRTTPTYGLSAGVWTEKGSRILWMVRKLKAGVVWANTFNRFDPTSPFGGYKESGFGREGGMHGLHAYVRLEDR